LSNDDFLAAAEQLAYSVGSAMGEEDRKFFFTEQFAKGALASYNHRLTNFEDRRDPGTPLMDDDVLGELRKSRLVRAASIGDTLEFMYDTFLEYLFWEYSEKTGLINSDYERLRANCGDYNDARASAGLLAGLLKVYEEHWAERSKLFIEE
jgi:hypothetical protein